MTTLDEQLDECRKNNQIMSEQVSTLQKKVTSYRHARPQLYLAYATGLFFVLILLYLALRVDQPTPWQYTLFRTILSLGAAGVAAILPGDLNVRYKNVIRATGALGVFFVVFKINPASLAGIEPPLPTQSFEFKILSSSPDGPKLNCFTFPYSDIQKIVLEGKLFKSIQEVAGRYGDVNLAASQVLMLRKSDEKSVTHDGDILAPRNDGIIVIDKALLTSTGDTHLLFTTANTQSCK
jgi:hypothetical protein